MKAGIVGLPNVGKSTLFNCLSNVKAQSYNKKYFSPRFMRELFQEL